MKRLVAVFALAVTFVLCSATAQAASVPAISGNASGIELCPQFICGAAVFAIGYQGQIGARLNAAGVIATVLKHGDLPTLDHDYSAPIYGGKWELLSLFVLVKGDVVSGSITLIKNSDNSDSKTFHVTAELSVTKGGPPTLHFDGILDHNPAIPTIKGTIF